MPIASLLGLLLLQTPGFSTDPADHSAWMRHSCRIQQVSYRGGGVPEDYTGFCECFDAELRDTISAEAYRVFALGSQGALRDRSMLDDWAAARDEAQRLFPTLSPEEQAGAGQVLQGALGACMGAAE